MIYNKTGQYSTELFTQRAEELITKHDVEQPMFLYLAFQAVHGPIQAPQDVIDELQHIKHEGRRNYAAMVVYMDRCIGRVSILQKQIGDAPLYLFQLLSPLEF